jgi:hypothetical protein
MSITALIAENILIGCFAWSWIVALLFRVGVLNGSLLAQVARQAQDHTAVTSILAVVLAYPVGAMMNTVCYLFVAWLFAKRINAEVMRDLDLKTFNEIYVYVLQHGSKQLVDEIQSFIVPVMRLSRAVAPNFLVLGTVLASWGIGPQLPYACIAICIGLLALPAFYIAAKEWKGEYVAAYRMLRDSAAKPPL